VTGREPGFASRPGAGFAPRREAGFAPLPDAGFAPAKVNLYLRITGRRGDGYHLLDSLAVFAGLGDRVSARAADRLELTLAGPEAAALGAVPDNLVLRAARALAEAAGIPAAAALLLEKRLPVASGIGGGSADAAAALRVLDALWAARLGPEGLRRLASGLGRRCAGMRGFAPGPDARGGGGPVGGAGAAAARPAAGQSAPAPGNAGGCSARGGGGLLGGGHDAGRLRRCGGPGGLAAAARQRPAGRGGQAVPPGGRGAAGHRGAARLPAGADERLRRHCFGLFPDPARAGAAAAALPAAWWRWGGGLA
jgi:4-diphosphocytidyl-2-C-methyl-D-erythritol kinase